MPSPFEKFIASFADHFEQWHDGTGYPLDLLEKMSAHERQSVKEALVGRLANGGNWRDLEALMQMEGKAILAKYQNHPDLRVRRMAAGAKEAEVLKALMGAQVMENFDEAIDMAAECNTPAVRRQVLKLALTHPDRVVRVNYAGLLSYLCGASSEVFDWEQRPFFLELGEEDPVVRELAAEKLRKLLEDFEGAANG